ncbi:formate dehydrogenase accessory sulfurtransferase FdhD [Sphingomonas jatrophae]|uniref:Sulfur carrier protein FdhD n=1 Tax=Sphingomonas jatrophae TaxID=1166337 RepID=A0A1I6MA35_9SPHN|nr:formate dehydrogenase accessory sulfurtransferase FdhD [Sphingomonas jatrophae]SFS12575.1 FdhD protein [Sphingomonas jatrophae]
MDHVPACFTRIAASGERTKIERPVAAEVPVAIEYDGIGYAVLMATPSDLPDLARGFAIAERLVDGMDEPVPAEAHETARGIVLRASLPVGRRDRLLDRVRHRATESGCGLCGVESLDQALRPLPRIAAVSQAGDAALFAALAALRDHQPLAQATGAVHAAALCGADGAIRLVREDVGRHNALDKLIGAMAAGGLGWDGGFALLSSRCSFELVEKAALAGCPLLVTVSAATGLALARAREAGLRLVTLARADAVLES